MIRRAQAFLPIPSLEILYQSIARPTMEYCCSVWGNCPLEHLDRLLTAQKRAARILLKTDKTSSSLTLFRTLRLIPISDIIIIRILTIVQKSLYGGNQPHIYSMLTKPQHSYRTRSSKNMRLFLPKVKTNFGKRSFSFLAAKLWNTLDAELSSCSCTKKFHRSLVNIALDKLNSIQELKNNRLY
jgi:hypothetical protein